MAEESADIWRFDKEWVLRNESGEQFRSGSTALYEKLCRMCHRQVADLIESQCGVREWEPPGPRSPRPVAKQQQEEKPEQQQCSGHTVIEEEDMGRPFGPYASSDVFTNDDTLLLLLRGAGDRTLCWSESLCVREGLMQGSMLPYIQQGVARGFSVVVASPNLHCYKVSERARVYSDHLKCLWGSIISKSPARRILVVAHSYGGVAFLHFIRDVCEETGSLGKAGRVTKLALVESTHKPYKDFSPHSAKVREMEDEFLMSVGRAFICSPRQEDPLPAGCPFWDDEDIETSIEMVSGAGCQCFAAGTTDHERAPCAAIEPVFAFLTDLYL